MNSSASRRVFKGAGANISSIIVTFSEKFLLVPFFISVWSNQTYGVWLSLLAMVAFLGVIDSAYQSTMANELCRLWFTHQKSEFRGTVRGAVLLNLLWQMSLSLLFIFFVWDGRFYNWIGASVLSPAHYPSAVFLSGFIFLNGLILAITGVFGKLYGAVGLFAEGTLLGIAFRIFIMLALFVGLKNHLSIPQMMVVYLLCNLVYALFLFAHTWQFWGGHDDSARKHFKNALTVLKPALFFLPSALALWAHVSGVQLLTTRLLGPSETVVVATTKTLAGIILIIPPLLASPLLPELTRLFSTGSHTRGIEISVLATRILVPLGALIVCAMGILGGPIFSLWLKGRVEWRPDLFSLYCIQVLMFTFHYSLALSLASQNRMRFVGLANLLSFIMTMLASLIGLKLFGVVGAALGSALSESMVAFIIKKGIQWEHPEVFTEIITKQVNHTYLQVLGFCGLLFFAMLKPGFGFSLLAIASIGSLIWVILKSPELKQKFRAMS